MTAIAGGVNLENANWLFGCKATSVHKNSRVCDVGENLSEKLSRLVPSRGKRRVAHSDLRRLINEIKLELN